MNRKITFCMLAALAVLFAAAVVQGAAAPKPPDKPKPVIYVVAEVKSIQGIVLYEPIPIKSLADRVKECRVQYTKALDDWKRAKADALKKKEKFDQQKPVEPYMKRVGPTFKTEELAREYATKQQEKMDEAKKKAEEEKKKEGEKPPAETGTGEKPAGDTGTKEGNDKPATDTGTKEEGDKPATDTGGKE